MMTLLNLKDTICATPKAEFSVEVLADVPYSQVEGQALLLDLYLPQDD
ncbi:hypothetical protein HYR99_16720, partial [Candidatus Poribacteria bacterium]|nr:hypothetical protein [Candidatus Poribacteria bacterium]